MRPHRNRHNHHDDDTDLTDDEYDLLRVADPSAYTRRLAVRRSQRVDGRALTAHRAVHVDRGTLRVASRGSAMVRCGNTAVLASVRARLLTAAEPSVTVRVELPALCQGRLTTDEALILTDFAQGIFAGRKRGGGGGSGGAADEHLGVEAGDDHGDSDGGGLVDRAALRVSSAYAWSVFIDAVCLNHDGNVRAAVVRAVWAALCNTRLPAVRERQHHDAGSDRDARSAGDDDGNEAVELDEQRSQPFPLRAEVEASARGAVERREARLECVSSAFMGGGDGASTATEAVMLADPTAAEEDAASTLVTVVRLRREGGGGGGGGGGGEEMEEVEEEKKAAEAAAMTHRVVFMECTGAPLTEHQLRRAVTAPCTGASQ